MLMSLVDRMEASGMAARAAVADAWGTAHAAARFLALPIAIIPSGEAEATMRDLPIRALRLPAPIVEGLHVLGFERIGDLEDTPKAPLAHRFGPELMRRLEQAMGRAPEPFEPVRSPELIEVRRAFGEPIGAAETIARYTAKLVDQLCAALEQQGLGARRLDLLLHRVDNRIEAIRVGTAAPVRDGRRLTRLLTDRIETIDPGFGIELMTLTATLAEPLRDRQTISSLVAPEEPDISDLIDVIANRLGASRLYRFAPVESDVPERSVRRVAPTAPDDGASWPGDWPRPSRLLSRPSRSTQWRCPDNRRCGSPRGIRRRVARGRPRAHFREWLREAETTSVRTIFARFEGGERRIYRAGDGEIQRPARTNGSARDLRMSGPRYAELQVTSHFSFLRGASSCDELFAQAALLGIEALAVVDRNSLAGVVRAHEAAKTTGVRLVVGCRLDLADGTSLLVYPRDRPAYGRLCRLLSLGKSRGGKGLCHLEWGDVVAYGEGLIAVLVPDVANDICAMQLRRLREAFGKDAYLALTLRRRPNDELRIHELANLATQMQVTTIITNDVLFHHPERRVLQDVVTCIRHNITIDDAGFRRERHADRHLKPPEEMQRLFGRYPEALARTMAIAEQCRFSLDELVLNTRKKTMPGFYSPAGAREAHLEGRRGAIPKACRTR